jgi:hypothetical protein
VDVLLYANSARRLAAEFGRGPQVAPPGAAY